MMQVTRALRTATKQRMTQALTGRLTEKWH